jgi:hypothetical protein
VTGVDGRGADLEGALIARDRLLDPPEFQKYRAGVLVRFGVARLRGGGVPIARERLFALSRLEEHVAEIVVRLGKIRIERECPPVARRRLLQQASACQCIAEIHVRGGIGRCETSRRVGRAAAAAVLVFAAAAAWAPIVSRNGHRYRRTVSGILSRHGAGDRRDEAQNHTAHTTHEDNSKWKLTALSRV